MSYLPQAKIESAANDLLRKYGKWKGVEIKPPIDIDDIIEGYFGLQLTAVLNSYFAAESALLESSLPR